MHKYAFLLLAILFGAKAQSADVALNIEIKDHQLEVGEKTTCSILLINEGRTTTGPITVQLYLNPGTEVLGHVGNLVSFNNAAKTCLFSGFAANESQKTIELTIQVNTEGPSIICAEVAQMTEKDIDSTPGNAVHSEDDFKYNYITVPIMICSNQDIRLNAFALKGHSYYSWFRDGELIPGENKDFIEITKVGTYTYKVPNSQNGNDYFSAPVIVGKRDPATLVQLALGETINTCAGEHLSVKANAYNGTPPYNYKWSNNLNWDLSKPLKANMGLVLTAVVTDKNGCQNKQSVRINVRDCKKSTSTEVITSQN